MWKLKDGKTHSRNWDIGISCHTPDLDASILLTFNCSHDYPQHSRIRSRRYAFRPQVNASVICASLRKYIDSYWM